MFKKAAILLGLSMIAFTQDAQMTQAATTTAASTTAGTVSSDAVLLQNRPAWAGKMDRLDRLELLEKRIEEKIERLELLQSMEIRERRERQEKQDREKREKELVESDKKPVQAEVGAYSKIPQQDAKNLLATEEFQTILKFANDYWFSEFKEGLGTVVGIQRQVVSGLNYKIAFKPLHMRADHLAVVVVNVDAQTNQLKVISSEVVKRGNPSENSSHLRN